MKNQQSSEDGLSVFQPDFLLPAQFFTGSQGKGYADGERRLMFAILQDALECFQKKLDAHDNRSQQLGTDAEEWFSSDDRSWLFSFVNVCETLGIDPGFLRRGLFAWKEAQEQQRSQAQTTAQETAARHPGRKRGALHAA